MQRGIALIGQSDSSPLRQALACGGGAITERSKVRRDLPLSAHILIENSIYNPADRTINRTSIYESLVISRAVSYIETVSPVSIPLRINPVQSEGDNCINICPQGSFRPGGVNFAAGYVFYIIGKGYLYVGSRGCGSAQMDRNGVWDNYLAQDT